MFTIRIERKAKSSKTVWIETMGVSKRSRPSNGISTRSRLVVEEAGKQMIPTDTTGYFWLSLLKHWKIHAGRRETLHIPTHSRLHIPGLSVSSITFPGLYLFGRESPVADSSTRPENSSFSEHTQVARATFPLIQLQVVFRICPHFRYSYSQSLSRFIIFTLKISSKLIGDGLWTVPGRMHGIVVFYCVCNRQRIFFPSYGLNVRTFVLDWMKLLILQGVVKIEKRFYTYTRLLIF